MSLKYPNVFSLNNISSLVNFRSPRVYNMIRKSGPLKVVNVFYWVKRRMFLNVKDIIDRLNVSLRNCDNRGAPNSDILPL
jgi:hypothetical protein